MTASVTFPAEQLSIITTRYLAGESTRAIAVDFGCSTQPIQTALRDLGVYQGRERLRSMDVDVEAAVVARRAAGQSITRIAKELGVGTHAVINALERQGVHEKRRSGFSPVEEDDILTKYKAQESVTSISEGYGCSRNAVVRLLTKQGVFQPRRYGKYRPDDVGALVARYVNGMTAAAIARAEGVTITPIIRILREAGVYDGQRNRAGHKFTHGQKREMVRRYEAGESIYKVAKAFDEKHPQTIWKILRSLDVELRDKAWRGGRVASTGGYVAVAINVGDPFREMANVTGYVLEHRLVMARSLGRPLTRSETVHHINGVKTDNRLENLQLRQGKHGKGVRQVCLDCGSTNIRQVKL